MHVTETAADGLKRELKIVIGKADLKTKLDAKIDEIKDRIQLKGFRPGKVPAAHLKKTYGKSLMGEIIQETVNETSQAAITERSLRPAQQPRIELEGTIESVIEGDEDLTFKVELELMPEFVPVELSTLELNRLTAEVADGDIEDALQNLASQQQSYSPRGEGETAQGGDSLMIDFIGRIDGVAFDGGTGEGVQLVIGSKRFIPGFEDQLLGAAAGEKRDVKVTFPADYPSAKLAGKEAVFDVTVKTVSAPDEVKIDDAFAASLGLESLEKLKERIKEQISADYGRAGRAHLKRALLDALDVAHSFELPKGMVDMEFEAIWNALEAEMKKENQTFPDEGKTEDEAKAEYRAIAERRVRLGLVLAEIGRLNNLSISQDELTRAVAARARQFPGQEKRVFEYYQKNPAALAEIRAPLFEDKVVDFIVELAKVSDVVVSKEDLFTDPDELIERRKVAAGQ